MIGQIFLEGILSVLTGHSSLEKVLMQASSLASQTETRASAEPVAKYLPHLEQAFNWSHMRDWQTTNLFGKFLKPAELNADAVARVCLQYVLYFQFRPGQDLREKLL